MAASVEGFRDSRVLGGLGFNVLGGFGGFGSFGGFAGFAGFGVLGGLGFWGVISQSRMRVSGFRACA